MSEIILNAATFAAEMMILWTKYKVEKAIQFALRSPVSGAEFYVRLFFTAASSKSTIRGRISGRGHTQLRLLDGLAGINFENRSLRYFTFRMK